jgi:hypothetical protein
MNDATAARSINKCLLAPLDYGSKGGRNRTRSAPVVQDTKQRSRGDMPRSFSGSGVSPSSLSLDARLNPNVAHAAQTVVVVAASVYYFGLTLWRRATVATEAARVRVSSTREVREIPGDC